MSLFFLHLHHADSFPEEEANEGRAQIEKEVRTEGGKENTFFPTIIEPFIEELLAAQIKVYSGIQLEALLPVHHVQGIRECLLPFPLPAPGGSPLL